MYKLSTRIGANWLVLTHLRERTWRLQVLGDTPLEAEVTARDEAEAKNSAIAAAAERLNIESVSPTPTWNVATTSRWDSRESRSYCYPRSVPCDEKFRLLEKYDEAARLFSQSVKTLNSQAGTIQRAGYKELLMAADEARLEAEAARLALDQHVVTHRC